MGRIQYFSTVLAELGGMLEYISPLTAVPLLIAVAFQGVFRDPSHGCSTGHPFPSRVPLTPPAPEKTGYQALVGLLFGGSCLAGLCACKHDPFHARP